MLINWDKINQYINKPINGILHLGAHLAEELSIYNFANINQVIWIEANECRVKKIKEIVPDHHQVICATVTDEENKEIYFNEANNGQSSSIFEFGTHSTEHPEIYYVNKTKQTTRRLDSLKKEYNFTNFNFINLDIQGAELLAIKGMGDMLNDVQYIYTEVNTKKLYEGCCLISDLDNYLVDFERVITSITSHGWGDAFYVRKPVFYKNVNLTYTNDPYATHQLPLILISQITDGNILELGVGDSSVVLLHKIIENSNRKLVSIEDEKKWTSKFDYLKNNNHAFISINQSLEAWKSKIDELSKSQWSIVLVDQGGCQEDIWRPARKYAVQKMIDFSDYIIVHDADLFPEMISFDYFCYEYIPKQQPEPSRRGPSSYIISKKYNLNEIKRHLSDIELNNNFIKVGWQPEYNGEIDLAESLPKDLVVFDVGCHSFSQFLEYEGEVHYFDPLDYNIDRLKIKKNKNKKSFYNGFGLSDENEIIKYYPKYESFLNRTASMGINNEDEAFELEVNKGDDYIKKHNISKIDLLKIDTEGYELKVLNGLTDSIDKIKYIQFEYGGAYLDAKIKLSDVCNFLRLNGFKFFYYITPQKLYTVTNFEDHYNYSNIFCSREKLEAKAGGSDFIIIKTIQNF